jgi:hypothetical protein
MGEALTIHRLRLLTQRAFSFFDITGFCSSVQRVQHVSRLWTWQRRIAASPGMLLYRGTQRLAAVQNVKPRLADSASTLRRPNLHMGRLAVETIMKSLAGSAVEHEIPRADEEKPPKWRPRRLVRYVGCSRLALYGICQFHN